MVKAHVNKDVKQTPGDINLRRARRKQASAHGYGPWPRWKAVRNLMKDYAPNADTRLALDGQVLSADVRPESMAISRNGAVGRLGSERGGGAATGRAPPAWGRGRTVGQSGAAPYLEDGRGELRKGELQRALARLAKGKATGPDIIPAELWQRLLDGWWQTLSALGELLWAVVSTSLTVIWHFSRTTDYIGC